MAPIPTTPRRLGAGRSRKSTNKPRSDGEARVTIPKVEVKEVSRKRRYIPGGPGGGGRYVYEDGTEAPVGGTGPGGYNYTGPRGRIGRENAANGIQPVVYPRRDRSTRTRTIAPRAPPSAMRYSSAAQAAAAVQNEGYKPREERGWEEFHPSLDIDISLHIYTAQEVDGILAPRPITPLDIPYSIQNSLIQTPNGDLHSNGPAGETTPSGSTNGNITRPTSLPGTPSTRRSKRPTANLTQSYGTRSKAITPSTPKIAPILNQSIKERLTLPQPSFRFNDALSRFEDKASGQVRYVDRSMANMGYQETDRFVRDEVKLIRASTTNLDEEDRVEYDMDEQDDKWLEQYNTERKQSGLEPVTRELFEIAITKIEKEWYTLEKRIPKPNPKPPQTHRPRSSSAAAVNGEPQVGEEQDSKCAICDDGDCENTNAIVFCDGCDLAVHQECYGVPFIPEGQWLCRKCQLIGRNIPTCIFCPNVEGAFKQTNASKWSHLLCAMWIPEVSLGNTTFMEPIMDVEKVPKTRWKLLCYLCNQKMGACIQCGNKSCFTAFHVTCARKARLYLKMKNNHGTLSVLDGTTVLKAFCDKHCPEDYQKDNSVQQATREAKSFYRRTMKNRLWADSQASALSMAASHQHVVMDHMADQSQGTGSRISFTLGDKNKPSQLPRIVWKLPAGAPVIPAIVFDSIEASMQKFNVRKKKEFLGACCKYWTLKRESRRGAALIKRFQLQNETFSSMEVTRRNYPAMGPTGRSRLDSRIQFAQKLVDDLARLKELSEDVERREREKLDAALLEQEFVDTVYFPVAKLLPPILDKAFALDGRETFGNGFKALRMELSKRHYVEAIPFVKNFCLAISAGLINEPALKTDLKDENGSKEAPTTQKMRERKKAANRIIKAVESQLEAAVRAECDITKRSSNAMLVELRRILEIGRSPLPIPAITTDQHDIGAMDIDTVGSAGNIIQAVAQGVVTATQVMDLDVHDEDALGEEIDENELLALAPSRNLQEKEVNHSITSDNAHQSKADYGTKFMGASDTPPDTSGYTIPEPKRPNPPTPPISNGGAYTGNGQENGGPEGANFLIEGGIPWYVKQFDPVGTSILDLSDDVQEEAMRPPSEILSEIADEDMIGMEGMEVGDAVEESIGEEKAVTTPKAKAKAKPKKRRKSNFR